MKCAIGRSLVISPLIVLFISGCVFFASDNANQTEIAKSQIAQITNTQVYTVIPAPTVTKVVSVTITATAGNVITTPTSSPSSFSFVTLSDAQDNGVNLPATADQALALNPNFGIFIGDLESEGVTQIRMDESTTAFGSLYPKLFIVRGNHDDLIPGSAHLWESYFTSAKRPLPEGITNYAAVDTTSNYLNYSFDYGNSRFIGLDVPWGAEVLTTSELNFLDARLTDAESNGLVHAFLFFHVPPYCTEGNHCACTAKSDSSCTPSALIAIINQHPIVDAVFSGHEHLLAWTHMDNTRVSDLTHPYEQFLTAPSGANTYNDVLYPDRVDHIELQDEQAFGYVTVNGSSFTVNFYRVGTLVPVWTKTFTK